ncbi:hypothetical protein [Methanotorris formicicus]|nr:hypothetical protein [Methanotorris formicicus]
MPSVELYEKIKNLVNDEEKAEKICEIVSTILEENRKENELQNKILKERLDFLTFAVSILILFTNPLILIIVFIVYVICKKS